MLRVRDLAPLVDYERRVQVRVSGPAGSQGLAGSQGPQDGHPQQRLQRLEDALIAGLGGAAVLLAVVTAAGYRDYWLQVGGDARLEDWAARLRGANPELDLDFRVSQDAEWSFVSRLREECRVADADRVALDRLAAEGGDLATQRELRYYLRFPSEGPAADAAQVLRDHDYEVHVTQGISGTDWQVVASHRERATAAIIAHMRSMLGQFAHDRGGVFEGWEGGVRGSA